MINKKRNLKKDENGKYIVTGEDLGDYFSRFNEYARSNESDIHKDEIFLQCIKTDNDSRYYNPAWFVSNEARVLSFAKGVPKFLTPVVKPDKPKYRFLRNTFSDKWVKLHRLVALYHHNDSDDIESFKNLEVHHVYANSKNMSVEEFNSKDNIQLLTRAKHNVLTNIEKVGKNVFDEKFTEAEGKCGKNGVIVEIPNDYWSNVIKNYVATHDDAYLCLVNEETGEIESLKYLTIKDIKTVGI